MGNLALFLFIGISIIWSPLSRAAGNQCAAAYQACISNARKDASMQRECNRARQRCVESQAKVPTKRTTQTTSIKRVNTGTRATLTTTRETTPKNRKEDVVASQPAAASGAYGLQCDRNCGSGNECVLDPQSGNQLCIASDKVAYCQRKYSNSSDYLQCLNSRAMTDESETQGQCPAQFQQLVDECTQLTASAAYSCDSENDAGISKVILAMGKQTTGGIAAACTTLGQISKDSSAAFAAYRMICANAQDNCRNSCAKALQMAEQDPSCSLEAAQVQVARCDAFSAQVQQAQQALENFMTASAYSKQCSAFANGSAVNATFCQANPTYEGCLATTDCTNAEAKKSNRVCICAANPTDPTCSNLTMKTAGNNGGSGLNGIGSSGRTTDIKGNAKGSSLGGDIPSLDDIAHGTPGDGKIQEIDGRQGAGAGIGGGSGGGGDISGGYGGGAAGEEEGLAVNAGFYNGGSGGGGFAGGSGYNGGSGGSGYVGGNGSAGSGNSNIPDLRSFLPGQKYDPTQRGIAGATGADGITGPHSNIWQKIQNRYQHMTPSLLP